MIPNILHQIWMQGEKNIPSKYLLNVKKNKTLNQGYEYKLWDEALILEYFFNCPSIDNFSLLIASWALLFLFIPACVSGVK